MGKHPTEQDIMPNLNANHNEAPALRWYQMPEVAVLGGMLIGGSASIGTIAIFGKQLYAMVFGAY